MEIFMNNHSEHNNCHVDPVEKVVDPEKLTQAESSFLLVWGMGCPTCAMRVRNSLLQLDGVLSAEINLERGLAQVLYDPALVTPDMFPEAVAAAGNDGRHRYAAQVLA
jgi:copper chaperone CopZ